MTFLAPPLCHVTRLNPPLCHVTLPAPPLSHDIPSPTHCHVTSLAPPLCHVTLTSSLNKSVVGVKSDEGVGQLTEVQLEHVGVCVHALPGQDGHVHWLTWAG